MAVSLQKLRIHCGRNMFDSSERFLASQSSRLEQHELTTSRVKILGDFRFIADVTASFPLQKQFFGIPFEKPCKKKQTPENVRFW